MQPKFYAKKCLKLIKTFKIALRHIKRRAKLSLSKLLDHAALRERFPRIFFPDDFSFQVASNALIECNGSLHFGKNCKIVMPENSKIICETFSFHDNCLIVLGANSRLILGEAGWCFHGVTIEVAPNATISIGKRSTIQMRCNLHGEIFIGDDTLFAPDVFVSSGAHVFDRDTNLTIRQQDSLYYESKQVRIGNNCCIGVHSWIAPGVALANSTIIGANSVVTCDTLPNSVYAGVPAKLLRRY